MIRVGGGYQTFVSYLEKNVLFCERMLVILMIKSEKSLEFVVNALINGLKIHNIGTSIQSDTSSQHGENDMRMSQLSARLSEGK